MWKPLVILVLCMWSLANAVPLGMKKNMPIMPQQEDPMLAMAEDEEPRPEMMISRLNLPSNATSIRADISDGFSCDNKTYGYYADVENECQIFHVCLPVTYADGKENTFRWSFICPEETVFSQEYFTCMRSEDMSIDCEESFKYYELNRNFGMIEPESVRSSEAEEEIPMEDMPREPSSEVEDEGNNLPAVVVVPMKKQTIKVQSTNRRRTQTNRVAIDNQRKKVQPLRKSPAAPAITAKPIVEDVPMLEQEVERTTMKYQRFTKRPTGVIPEQAKPEAPKPEQEIVRQDLFAQKRKRPQIFFPSRFDATVPAETGSKVGPSLKTDLVLQKLPEPIPQDQAEAQASEITEVSIKPVDFKSVQAEKKKPMAESDKPAMAFIPLKAKEPMDNQPMPENTQSRVEVVEIPIQRLDEPLKVEEPAAPAPPSELPLPEEPKPVEEVMATMKVEKEKPMKDVPLDEASILDGLKKIIAASEKPKDSEIVPIEPVLEPETVQLNEPEQLQQTVKLTELPTIPQVIVPEAEKLPEDKVELKTPEEVKSTIEESFAKPVEASADLKPETLLKSDTPSAQTPSLIDAPEAKPDLEKPEEAESSVKTEELVATIPEPESTAVKFEPVKEEISASQPVIAAAEPEKILIGSTEPLVLTKADTVSVEDPKPLSSEPISAAAEVTTMNEQQKMEAPSSESSEQLKLDIPSPATEQKPDKQLESELPSAIQEASKTVEVNPTQDMTADIVSKSSEIEEPMKEQMDLKAKPLENEPVAEPVKEELSVKSESPKLQELNTALEPMKDVIPIKAESVEVLEEQPSEVPSQESSPELPQSSSEKESSSSVTTNEEAQSLILDFISSLVNSENSNFEEQSATANEMSKDSQPETSVAETTKAEEKLQTQEEQIYPMYIPMMPSNDQMYHIPVQVIETPEPDPIIAEPAVGEPKLPLSVDDVVELVKESLDTPAEKENLVQEPSSDESSSQPQSEEVKPIYHRYIELGSNLLKPEALTASDDEPVIISSDKIESPVEDKSSAEELLKTNDKPSEPEKPNSKSEIVRDSLPEVQAIQTEVVQSDNEPAPQTLIEGLKEGRSMNRFKMDPRKRRFLFRSDAS